MAESRLKIAVVSADPHLRGALSGLLETHPKELEVVTDVPRPAGQLDADTLDQLQQSEADVVIVDFASDPVAGLRFLRLMSDSRPSRHFIAAGPKLDPELLLEAMRAGASEYLPTPVDPRDVAEALRRLGRKLGRVGTMGGAAGHVVTLMSAKGGTGVTTAAANLAVHLRRVSNRRVLLLDLDLEYGATAVVMGMRPRYSVLDVIENFQRIDESLLSSLVLEHSSGVHVLPAPAEAPPGKLMNAEQARAILNLLRQHYDAVVVDLARPSPEIRKAVLSRSDEVFLVLAPDMGSLRNSKKLLPAIQSDIGAKKERLRVLLNGVRADDEIGSRDVAAALGLGVSWELAMDATAVTRSVNVGRPLVMNGNRSRYGRDVRAVGASVAREIDPSIDAKPAGFMSRLRARMKNGK